MKSENAVEIKKEDKKLKKKYFLIMVLALVGGFFAGFGSALIADIFSGGLTGMIAAVRNFFIEYSSVLGLLLGLMTATIVTIIYKRNRKCFASWDGENEIILDKMENELSVAILILNISTVLFMVLLAISSLKALSFTLENVGIYVASIAINLAVELVASNRIVNFAKEINPEKKGSTYDTKFQKKWFDSCDEAEKLNIYKSSYAAYKAVINACTVLWLVCLFCMTIFNCGLLPVVMVGAIWMVATVSYCVEGIRLSKNTSVNME